MISYQRATGSEVNTPDLSSYSTRTQTYTASGAIAAQDIVYVSGNSTVKTIYPSAMATATTLTT